MKSELYLLLQYCWLIAGSQFWNPGLFEVSKATSVDDTAESDGTQEPLEVTVSSDLEGKAQLCVVIMEGEQQVDKTTLNCE